MVNGRKCRKFILKQIKKSKKFSGKIYSIVDSTINLKLIAFIDANKKINIDEDLIEKRYAVKRKKSYLWNYNHELRTNINNEMSMEEKEYHEEKQYDNDHITSEYLILI